MTASKIPQSRMFGFLACLTIIALSAGCGGSGSNEPKNSVSGKVTLGGKAVSGMIVFVSADNKENTFPISVTDGSYIAADVPNGTAKIYIKSVGGPVKAPDSKGAPAMTDLGGGTAVPAPAKYGSAATSGLSFEVKGGKQTYDIPLN